MPKGSSAVSHSRLTHGTEARNNSGLISGSILPAMLSKTCQLKHANYVVQIYRLHRCSYRLYFANEARLGFLDTYPETTSLYPTASHTYFSRILFGTESASSASRRIYSPDCNVTLVQLKHNSGFLWFRRRRQSFLIITSAHVFSQTFVAVQPLYRGPYLIVNTASVT